VERGKEAKTDRVDREKQAKTERVERERKSTLNQQNLVKLMFPV